MFDKYYKTVLYMAITKEVFQVAYSRFDNTFLWQTLTFEISWNFRDIVWRAFQQR